MGQAECFICPSRNNFNQFRCSLLFCWKRFMESKTLGANCCDNIRCFRNFNGSDFHDTRKCRKQYIQSCDTSYYRWIPFIQQQRKRSICLNLFFSIFILFAKQQELSNLKSFEFAMHCRFLLTLGHPQSFHSAPRNFSLIKFINRLKNLKI